MKLELVSPTWQDPKRRKMEGKAFRFPQLALSIIASLTPKEWDIHITDENVDDVDFDREVDLVGITVMTAAAPRAYEIADTFRKRGVKVVLGGMHPTALPEEAIQHADAVVIGEAEGIWERVIEDFNRGTLKKFYSSDNRPDLSNLPLPRRDLLKDGAYFAKNTVQTTRGCPFDCSFCSVSNFFGRTYRMRPVKDVIKEIEGLKGKFIAFLDDNIVGNLRYAKELFRALIPERKWWAGQASLNFVKDREVLKLLKESGCKFLFIGFESLSQANLREIGKKFNIVSKFKEAVKKIHDYGIGVEGAFVFGFDNDDKDVFKRTLEFVNKARIDFAQFGILTPFPGTRLYKKLEEENRIIDRDWAKYDIDHVVFKPKLMSPEELCEGTGWVLKNFYSYKSILKRILNLGNRAFPSLPLFAAVNTSYHRTVYTRWTEIA